jgi:hypothetical protein
MNPEDYFKAILRQLTLPPDAQTIPALVQALTLPDGQMRAAMVHLCEYGFVRATLSGFRLTHKGWERLEALQKEDVP